MSIKFSLKVSLLLFLSIFVACAGTESRIKQSNKLAIEHGFHRRVIEAGSFKVITFSRFEKKPEIATVFIEGDGFAFVDRNTASKNPTPKKPIGLKLALSDNSINVIYIARPCQFILASEDSNCSIEYWTDKRYSPKVVDSIGAVLDDYRKQQGIKGFRLVGFSGGATIATILAATRSDIVDLRTVAGNLDTHAFTRVHKLSSLHESLNPADYADSMHKLPQVHFLGSKDKVVTREVLESYLRAIKKSDSELACVQLIVAEGVSHASGWERFWIESGARQIPICQ